MSALRSAIARLLRNTTGASLTEFAMVSPFVILLIAGIADVGRYMWGGILVANVARAGALYGAQGSTYAANTSGIQAAANADAPQISPTVSPSPYCACDGATGTAVACNPNPCNPASQEDLFVAVTASYQFQPLIHWPLLPSSMTITKTNVEQVASH